MNQSQIEAIHSDRFVVLVYVGEPVLLGIQDPVSQVEHVKPCVRRVLYCDDPKAAPHKKWKWRAKHAQLMRRLYTESRGKNK